MENAAEVFGSLDHILIDCALHDHRLTIKLPTMASAFRVRATACVRQALLQQQPSRQCASRHRFKVELRQVWWRLIRAHCLSDKPGGKGTTIEISILNKLISSIEYEIPEDIFADDDLKYSMLLKTFPRKGRLRGDLCRQRQHRP